MKAYFPLNANPMRLMLAVAMALLCPGAADAGPAGRHFVSLATGTVSGLYFPVGKAICDAVNTAGSGQALWCSVESTPGSVYNVDSVASGENEFALVQSDAQFFAVNGEGRWQGRPASQLRAVMALYPETLTVIVREDSGIGTIEQLKGKRVNIGAPGTGSRVTWDELKGALKITEADLGEAAELKTDAATARLCANTLDASLMIVGHPSSMIERQLNSCRLKLLPVGGEAVDALVAMRPYYTAAAIPGRAYGLAADVPTFGVKATLVTSATVPEDTVHALTMAIMSNLEKLKQQQALAGLKPEDMAARSLTAPLHPGAARAFRDLGLLK
ncbi:TAXI family TRAP transporter solute-binding subunit [Aestuariivirga sp.]|jgi:TRAP transporter TAXI family solute receptor|uniref:TAXI family TRAP transporter solute-binding subunit n=1 Tax=Aestuariivirga sp. TaxID=2650926 RepID=UPI003782E247